jgi:hypothetical protein
MSGNAALSAARKRRASSSPNMPNINGIVNANGNIPGRGGGQPSYYNKNMSAAQQLMNQSFPESSNMRGSKQMPQVIAPPINIYENIELIKQQLTERTKLIQTQANILPPEKLLILQKQNEVQTQILRQKMAIAQQMEMAEKQQHVSSPEQPTPVPFIVPSSVNEPEFIYEKGIPRKNPKYKTPAELEILRKEAEMASRAPSYANANHAMRNTTSSITGLTPFVTILSDTGVIPPPVVVLKAHDTKLEEHNRVLYRIIDELSTIMNSNQSANNENTSRNGKGKGKGTGKGKEPERPEDEEDESEEEEEEELLMDVVINDLTNSREFVEGIVDKIVNETNLSEVIMKIEPLVKENQELRSLIHSQQQMMNEMNTMLLRLLNEPSAESRQNSVQDTPMYQDVGLDNDGLYEMSNIVLMPANSDVEPAVVIEDVVLPTDTETAQETAQEPEEPEEPEEPANNDTPVTASIPDEDDEYDTTPHFPEHISLLIREIPGESA